MPGRQLEAEKVQDFIGYTDWVGVKVFVPHDSGRPATFVDAINPHNKVLPVRGVVQIKYESMCPIRDRLRWPLSPLGDAVATWPETTLAVAVGLQAGGTITITAPLGLEDLFSMVGTCYTTSTRTALRIEPQRESF